MATTRGLLMLSPAMDMPTMVMAMVTSPHTDTATTRGRPKSTTSMLLPSPTTPMVASLTPTDPPRGFTRGLLMLRPATAMPTTVTAMVTSPRTAMDTTRGRPRPATVTGMVTSPRTAMVTSPRMATDTTRGRPRPATVTATATSPRMAMVTRTAMATTRGLLMLRLAIAMPITVTAMATSPRTATGTTRGLLMLRPATDMPITVTAMATTRGRLRPATVTAMVTSPRTAMVTTATDTT